MTRRTASASATWSSRAATPRRWRTLYRAFRGRDPSVEPLLEHRGLVPSKPGKPGKR